MKTIGKIFVILLVSFIATSCEKEEIIIDESLIELELKEFVKKNNITVCTIREYFGNGFWDPVQQSTFRFSNGFIVVSHYFHSTELSYNLEFLYCYRKDANNTLWLEFVKK